MNKGNTLIIDAFSVDNKYFPTAQSPNSNDGHIFYGYYKGIARHIGWMDLCQLKNIIKKHNISHIILQNIDTLGKIAKVVGDVKVCSSYLYNNFWIVKSVSSDEELVHCKPIYQTPVVGGWDIPENGEIPLRAQSYIRYLLTQTGVDSITCFTHKLKVTCSFAERRKIQFNSEPNS